MYQEKSLPLPIPHSFNVAKVVEVGTWRKNACPFQHCIRVNEHFWNSLNLGVILKYFLHHCLERVWNFSWMENQTFHSSAFILNVTETNIFWFVKAKQRILQTDFHCSYHGCCCCWFYQKFGSIINKNYMPNYFFNWSSIGVCKVWISGLWNTSLWSLFPTFHPQTSE